VLDWWPADQVVTGPALVLPPNTTLYTGTIDTSVDTAGTTTTELYMMNENYITLHKIVLKVTKITRTARTLYEIKGVMWEYSYEGKHIEKR